MQRRPSHFLALPLHHHSTLRSRISVFQNALLSHVSPPIPGLDRSIIIDPRRIHLTLGVMALGTNSDHTIEHALALLHSLRPKIAEILRETTSVKVRLETLDVLKYNIVRSGRTNSVNAHVLFLGPSLHPNSNEEDGRLWALCDLINQSFRNAGFVTETRPLKLHCTILNTSYRRPRSRLPFSYTDILASPACQSILPSPNNNSTTTATTTTRTTTSVPVNFGTFDISRVELWEMGSHGPNNEYISCGGLDFRTIM